MEEADAIDGSLLRADCVRCMDLCCVALSFDRSEWFSFDKAADVPCRYLSSRGCAVHASLAQRGLAGCMAYDCYGAGQRVTDTLFAGRSWRSHPELAPAMFSAFRALKHVHELRLLLCEAKKLELSFAQLERWRQLRQRLEPRVGWTVESLSVLDTTRCQAEVHDFLRSLSSCTNPALAKRRRRLRIIR